MIKIRRDAKKITPIRPPDVRVMQVDGFDIHYVQRGSGPHLVLLHGIAANMYTWRLILPDLEKHFTVTMLDLPGFGWSTKDPEASYDLDAQVGRVSTFLTSLEIDKAFLVGSSMGGAIALWMAKIQPERFTKVVVLAPAVEPRSEAYLASLIRPVLARPVQLAVTPWLVRQILPMVIANKEHIHPESVHSYLAPYLEGTNGSVTFWKAIAILRDRRLPGELKHLAAPVLILQGEKDRLVPRKAVEKLREILPISELVYHPHAGHHSMEDDPQWVNEKILKFFLPAH